MSSPGYTKFVSVEALGLVIGLALAGQALYKAQTQPEYDPSNQITLALTIIAGGWITPTRPIDRRLQQAVEPINPVIAGTPDTTTPDNQDNLPK